MVGDRVESLRRSGDSLAEMAVLFRTGAQTRAVEERLITLGVPYRVIGGPRFYERQEIRDAIAYARLLHQPADDLAFERIVNVPRRGVGTTALRQIHEAARDRQVPLYAATDALVSEGMLKGKLRDSLRELLSDFDRWRQQLARDGHVLTLQAMLDESGYTEMWRQDKSPEAPGRLENLKEFVRALADFETLAGFLDHVSLVMENEQNTESDRVSLMTLHAAKGLEFDTVFLPGWEEGLFPHQRSLDEQGKAGLEEERRLAHVGLTRARKRAKLYFATNRRVHGMWQTNIPSRFIDELPPEHVEVKEASGGTGGFGMSGYGPSRFDEAGAFGSQYTTPGWQRAQGRRGSGGFSENGQPRYVPDGVFNQDEEFDAASSSPPPLRGRSAATGGREGGNPKRAPLTIEGELIAKSTGTSSAFKTGDRVFHLKFGNGNVTAVDGNKLTIQFDKAGEKRVVDNYVERV